MPRRVPIALALGLALRLVATLAVHVPGRAGAVATLVDVPGSVAVAVGLWHLRRSARRGVLLAIASIAMWTMLATTQVAKALIDQPMWMLRSDWLGDALAPTPYVLYALVALAGVLFAFGAERNLGIAALAAALAVAAGVASSFAPDGMLALAAIAASVVLQIGIALRCTLAPDTARGARGLARAGAALWWFAIAVAFETIGVYVLLVNDVLTSDTFAYVDVVLELGLVAPVFVAMAATLSAADARIGGSWLFALAAVLLTFVHTDTIGSKSLTLVFLLAGPVSFALAVVVRHRRTLLAAGCALAVLAGGYVLLFFLAPRREPFEPPGVVHYVFVFVFAASQVIGYILLGGCARAAARVVAQDPRGLDRVFE